MHFHMWRPTNVGYGGQLSQERSSCLPLRPYVSEYILYLGGRPLHPVHLSLRSPLHLPLQIREVFVVSFQPPVSGDDVPSHIFLNQDRLVPHFIESVFSDRVPQKVLDDLYFPVKINDLLNHDALSQDQGDVLPIVLFRCDLCVIGAVVLFHYLF